jgi:hypothetical protein
MPKHINFKTGEILHEKTALHERRFRLAVITSLGIGALFFVAVTLLSFGRSEGDSFGLFRDFFNGVSEVTRNTQSEMNEIQENIENQQRAIEIREDVFGDFDDAMEVNAEREDVAGETFNN